MSIKHTNGECIEITGCTLVDGVSVDVTLTINTVKLIHQLGKKAAYAKGRKAQMARGLVKATVDKAANGIVRAQVRDKAEAQRKRLAEVMASKVAL